MQSVRQSSEQSISDTVTVFRIQQAKQRSEITINTSQTENY